MVTISWLQPSSPELINILERQGWIGSSDICSPIQKWHLHHCLKSRLLLITDGFCKSARLINCSESKEQLKSWDQVSRRRSWWEVKPDDVVNTESLQLEDREAEVRPLQLRCGVERQGEEVCLPAESVAGACSGQSVLQVAVLWRHSPGLVLPALPALCSAEAWLTSVMIRLLLNVSLLKQASFTKQLSITWETWTSIVLTFNNEIFLLTPSMVILVSAILVATTIFL